MGKRVENFMTNLQKKAVESFSGNEAHLGLAMSIIPIMGISFAFALERGLTEDEARDRAMMFGGRVGEILQEEIGG